MTLGGAVHALEPLSYAFSTGQIVMISEPSLCLDAMWIPYRRDQRLMKSILSQCVASPPMSSTSTSSSFSSPALTVEDNLQQNTAMKRKAKVIFCHADVKGAFMNDGMRSREGLEISDFPSNVPIYSGHFHKPHTVRPAVKPSFHILSSTSKICGIVIFSHSLTHSLS